MSKSVVTKLPSLSPPKLAVFSYVIFPPLLRSSGYVLYVILYALFVSKFNLISLSEDESGARFCDVPSSFPRNFPPCMFRLRLKAVLKLFCQLLLLF